MLDTVLQDLRFGSRALRAAPAVTLIAIASLALGSGANTAMFTIVNAALLRPLTAAASDELVYLFSGSPDQPWGPTSYPDYLDYRDHSDVFKGLAAYAEVPVSLGAVDGPEVVRGVVATGNFFGVLGVRA